MPYDPDKDFVHVSGFPVGHLAFAVNAASPIKSVKDLVELGRRQRITIGNFSPGTHPHMLAQQLNHAYGVQAEPVPYRGDVPMWVDLVSGQLTAAMGSLYGINPHVQSGKLRVIAVLSRSRTPTMPEVPTFEEQGFKEPVFIIEGWIGMFAPAGTPRELVQRVSALVQEAASTPRVSAIHKNFVLERPWTADEFEKIDGDTKAIWIALARSLNLSLD
jgi:tripartite-type tricarboxylate transporter receptor subunit TctC